MSVITVGTGSTNAPTMPTKPRAENETSKVDELNITVTDGSEEYKVSAEAQYLFEMQKYFYTLDTKAQDRAIEYFSQSNDPLNNKVADVFSTLQQYARDFQDGKIKINQDTEAQIRDKNLLDPNFIIDGKTEIGVRPNGTDVFRMDGKQVYSPAQASDSNPVLLKQLEALEKASSGLLRNRDAANVFGAVSNALVYSEHILLSADDVLHYNYAIEKARKTIAFVTAPEDLKATLTDILNKGIIWQDVQQSGMMTKNRQLIGNSQVGGLAADAVRIGSAAQALNQKMISTFKSSSFSMVDAGSLIKRMIAEQPNLIRFAPNKIDEALEYYRKDSSLYDKALNRESTLPEEERIIPTSEIDQKIFAASKSYALKVINEIQGYISNKPYQPGT